MGGKGHLLSFLMIQRAQGGVLQRGGKNFGYSGILGWMEFHLLVELIWSGVRSGFFPSLSVVRHGIGLPLPPLVFWTIAHKMS